jgi:hypothetical protein
MSNLTSLVDIASLVCANLKVFVSLPFLVASYEILKGVGGAQWNLCMSVLFKIVVMGFATLIHLQHGK